MIRRSKRHGLARWAWWRVLALAIFGFAPFGALLGYLPPISVSLARAGMVLSVLAILAVMWSWWTYSWWARLAAPAIWTMQILAIGARGWTLVIGMSWVWLVPILSAYLLAWVMPAINPHQSDMIWREQTTPQTRTGRALLGLALGIGPSAGVLGASIGMFGSRFGEKESVLLAIAALSSAVAIGIAFAISYQLWPERPWAKDTASHREA